MDADRTVAKQEAKAQDDAARGKIIAALWKKAAEERKAKDGFSLGIDWDGLMGRRKPSIIPHPQARRG